MDPARLDELPLDQRMNAADQMRLLRHAADATFLEFIASVDRESGWEVDGCQSLAAWLVQRYDCSHPKARQWAGIARRLDDIPALMVAFSEGRLSFEKLAVLARVAEPQDEAEWLARAEATGIEALTVAVRRVLKEKVDSPEQARKRRLRLRRLPDEEGSGGLINGWLPPAEFDEVEAALQRRADDMPKDPDTGAHRPLPERLADALLEQCRADNASQSDVDRGTVVLTVNLDDFINGRDGATLFGQPLGIDTIRRYACDGRLEILPLWGDEPVGLGRRQRVVSPKLARAVKVRDGHCRFPGCDRTRYGEAHHIQHWADGGPTDLNNLIWLCWHHHHLIHDLGWTVTGHPNNQLVWRRPDGTNLAKGPPKLADRIRHILEANGWTPPRPSSRRRRNR